VAVATTLGDVEQPQRAAAPVTLPEAAVRPDDGAPTRGIVTSPAAPDASVDGAPSPGGEDAPGGPSSPATHHPRTSFSRGRAAAAALSVLIVGGAARAWLSPSAARDVVPLRVPLTRVQPGPSGVPDAAVSVRDASTGDALERSTATEHPHAPRVERPVARPAPARALHALTHDPPPTPTPGSPAAAPSRIRVVGWK
jgi:hypothetical protein